MYRNKCDVTQGLYIIGKPTDSPEETEQSSCDLGLGSAFLELMPEAQVSQKETMLHTGFCVPMLNA